MKNIYYSRLLNAGILLVILFTSSCTLKGQVSYQQPVVPLVISIDTNGEISLEVEGEVSLPTPLGTFSAGVVLDPVEKFNAQNVLTIRVDDRSDYFYDLNGNDFDVRFDSGYYEKVHIQKIGMNIILEVKRKEEYQSQWFDFNSDTEASSAPPQNISFPNPIVEIKV
ncbi:MAG: hypothetical protein IPO22_14815 [Anaerolineales bacterium]|nr:hypothetical protein [Anaerolineales bacterium]